MKYLTISAIFMIAFCSLALADGSKPNFADTELQAFIDYVATTTGKTFLYDNTVSGKKVLLSNFRFETKEDLFKAFLSVIEYHGYILESVGDKGKEIIKIKRNIQGPWTSTPTIFSLEELQKVQNEDLFITMVIDLKHVSAKEVQATLRALRIVNPQGGNLATIESANCLLVTDFAPNVKRVYDVIRHMESGQKKDKVEEEPALKIEGQKISLHVPDDAEIFLIVQAGPNTSVTITTDQGNVLSHSDPNTPKSRLWLTPYAMEKQSLHCELQINNDEKSQNSNAKAEIAVVYESKKEKKDEHGAWNFSLDRPLPIGKQIHFSLFFPGK